MGPRIGQFPKMHGMGGGRELGETSGMVIPRDPSKGGQEDQS